MLLGLLAAATLPPLHLVFLWLPALTGLIWLIDGSAQGTTARRGFKGPGRAAYRAGWWFGIGFFGAGLYWLTFPFLVDAQKFAWMIPLALAGMAAGMAIFTGLTAWLAFISAPAGPARVVMFAVWWVGLEWVRSWIFTGFPWNFAGTSWTFSPAMLQTAALAGVYGLSFLTVLAAALPALLGDRDLGRRRRWAAAGAAGLILAAAWSGGAIRLAGAGTDSVAGVRLRLVQPNVAQKDKWRPDLREGHLRRLRRLSAAPAAGAQPTHVIWPEAAVPGSLEGNRSLLSFVAASAPPGGALITGAVRVRRRTPETTGTTGTTGTDGARAFRLWNSLHAVDSEGGLGATYDKSHLVPFGEYVPFRRVLSFSKLTAGRTDFSPGPGRVALDISGLPPLSPLICYEITYPGRVLPPASGPRPEWILNLTNDAWFGNSSGPYQHFASAQLRAVEEGLPMVRVANTGISGVVDAYGRTVASLGLGQEGILDVDLPKALAALTPYARYGNFTVLLLLLAASAGALSQRRRRRD